MISDRTHPLSCSLNLLQLSFALCYSRWFPDLLIKLGWGRGCWDLSWNSVYWWVWGRSDIYIELSILVHKWDVSPLILFFPSDELLEKFLFSHCWLLATMWKYSRVFYSLFFFFLITKTKSMMSKVVTNQKMIENEWFIKILFNLFVIGALIS